MELHTNDEHIIAKTYKVLLKYETEVEQIKNAKVIQ